MSFIETLLITNKIKNLKYHNKRMNYTRKHFYDLDEIDLKNYIKVIPNKRVRVLYDKEILKIEYFDLKPRKFEKFKIIETNIEYNFKYANREKLNKLKTDGYDEIIIVKNGFVTDTTISNLAFFDGENWLTPKTPLLKGTKREEFLEKGLLIEKEIKIDDLKNFSQIAMLNAILGFKIIKNCKIFV